MKILDRLSTETYGAYNAVEMSIYSRELNEVKQQSQKVDSEAQTILKNISLKITQEAPSYTNRKKQVIESGIDEYCQTKIKAE